MKRCRLMIVLVGAVAIYSQAASAKQQQQALEEEVVKMRGELASLRQDVAQLRVGLPEEAQKSLSRSLASAQKATEDARRYAAAASRDRVAVRFLAEKAERRINDAARTTLSSLQKQEEASVNLVKKRAQTEGAALSQRVKDGKGELSDHAHQLDQTVLQPTVQKARQIQMTVEAKVDFTTYVVLGCIWFCLLCALVSIAAGWRGWRQQGGSISQEAEAVEAGTPA